MIFLIDLIYEIPAFAGIEKQKTGFPQTRFL